MPSPPDDLAGIRERLANLKRTFPALGATEMEQQWVRDVERLLAALDAAHQRIGELQRLLGEVADREEY